MMEAARLEARASALQHTLTHTIDQGINDDYVTRTTAAIADLHTRADRWAASGTRGIGTNVTGGSITSSYNQVTQPTTVGLAIVTAFEELEALRNEMEELSAEIAGMFPETYGRIPKYEQAQIAYHAFNDAVVLGRDAGLTDPKAQGAWATHSIMVKVGKQTRQNRATSQRVRLGNTVQRLQSASEMLWKEGAEERGELEEIIEGVKDVVFPAAHG